MDVEENITWDRAEEVHPGCSAEYDQLTLLQEDGNKSPGLGEYSIELRWWSKGNPCAISILWVMEKYDREELVIPRTWIRYMNGNWKYMAPVRRAEMPEISITKEDIDSF